MSEIADALRLAIHDHLTSPREVARPCPNCGEIKWESELGYSSSISTSWGGSVLYGVCKKCADIHDEMNESQGGQE